MHGNEVVYGSGSMQIVDSGITYCGEGKLAVKNYFSVNMPSDFTAPAVKSSVRQCFFVTRRLTLCALIGIMPLASVADETPGGYTEEQINEMINNPLGELWMMYTQSDFAVYSGDALDLLNQDDKTMNFTLL